MPVQNFGVSKNITIPAGLTSIQLFMWGGGGGGGGGINVGANVGPRRLRRWGGGGGGGGSGAIGYWNLTGTPGLTYRLKI